MKLNRNNIPFPLLGLTKTIVLLTDLRLVFTLTLINALSIYFCILKPLKQFKKQVFNEVSGY